MSISQTSKPTEKARRTSSDAQRPKRGPRTAGDKFLRRFVLTVVPPGKEPEETGRYRTKDEAIVAFEPWGAQGAAGQVRSVSGPRMVLDLPVESNGPKPSSKPAVKRGKGPLTAPQVSQTEVGAKIMVTAWGETKSLYEWSSDPRAKAGYLTIRGRLSRIKPWEPERAISTPPSDNALKVYNLEKAPRYEAFGESKTVSEWLADPRCEASSTALRAKLKRGIPTYLALQSRTPSYWRKSGKDQEAFGERKSLWRWAEDPRCKPSYHVLKRRLEQGVPLERAMGGHDPRAHIAFGEEKTLRQWADDPRCPVSRQTLHNRLEAGIPLERAIVEPRIVSEKRFLVAFGESKTFSDWLRDPRCVVTRQAVVKRLADGVALEEALTAKSLGRKVARYTAFGESKTIWKWLADPRCRVSYPTVLSRLNAGVPFEMAINALVPVRSTYEMTAFGEKKTVGEWLKDGRRVPSRATLFLRLRAGLPLERALTMPEAFRGDRLDVSHFVTAVTSALATVLDATDPLGLETVLGEIERLVAEVRQAQGGHLVASASQTLSDTGAPPFEAPTSRRRDQSA